MAGENDLNKDNAGKLFDALSTKFNVGTKDEFMIKINDSSSRKKLYDATKGHFDNLGDTFYDFEDKLFEKKKEQVSEEEQQLAKAQEVGPQPMEFDTDDNGLAGHLSQKNIEAYQQQVQELGRQREELASQRSTFLGFSTSSKNVGVDMSISEIDNKISKLNQLIKNGERLQWLANKEKESAADDGVESYIATSDPRKIALDYLKETNKEEYDKYFSVGTNFSRNSFEGYVDTWGGIPFISSGQDSRERDDYNIRATGMDMIAQYMEHRTKAMDKEMRETFGEDHEKLQKFNEKTTEIIDLKRQMDALDAEMPESKAEYDRISSKTSSLDAIATKALAKLKRAEGRLLPKKETGEFTPEHEQILRELALDYNEKALRVNEALEELTGNEYGEKYGALAREYNDRIINRRNYLESLGPQASKLMDESIHMREANASLIEENKDLKMHPHYQKMEERKEALNQRFEELTNEKMFDGADEYVGAFAQPSFKVYKGLLESAFIAEQAMGDMDGYSWAESLYDMANTDTFIEDMYLPQVADVALFSENMNGDFQIANGTVVGLKAVNALGNLATFAASGMTGKAGVAASAYLMQIGDNYREALNAGMSRQQAAVTAEVISGVSAGIETIISEANVIGGIRATFREKLFAEVMKARAAGKILTKETIRQIGKPIYKDLMMQIPKNALGEGFEELGESVSTDLVKVLSNKITMSDEGIQYYDPSDIGDVYAYAEAFTIGAFTGMLTGGMGSFSSARKMNKIHKDPELIHPRLAEAIVSMGENQENLDRVLEVIGDNAEAKQEVMNLVERYRENVNEDVLKRAGVTLNNQEKFTVAMMISDVAEMSAQLKEMERQNMPESVIDSLKNTIAAKNQLINEIVNGKTQEESPAPAGDTGTAEQAVAEQEGEGVQQEQETTEQDGGTEQVVDETDTGDTTEDGGQQGEQQGDVTEQEAETTPEDTTEQKDQTEATKLQKTGNKSEYSSEKDGEKFTVSRPTKGSGWKVTLPDGTVHKKRFKNLNEAQEFINQYKKEGAPTDAEQTTAPSETPAETPVETPTEKTEEVTPEESKEMETSQDGTTEVPERSNHFADAARLAMEKGMITLSDLKNKFKLSTEDAQALLQELQDAGAVAAAFNGDKEVKTAKTSKIKTEEDLKGILDGNKAADKADSKDSNEQKKDKKEQQKKKDEAESKRRARSKPLDQMNLMDIMNGYPEIYKKVSKLVKDDLLEAEDALDYMKRLVEKVRKAEANKSVTTETQKVVPINKEFLSSVAENLAKLNEFLKDRGIAPKLTTVARRIFDFASSKASLQEVFNGNKLFAKEYNRLANDIIALFESEMVSQEQVDEINSRINDLMSTAPRQLIEAKLATNKKNLDRAVRNKKKDAVKPTYRAMAEALRKATEAVEKSDNLDTKKQFMELQNLVLEALRNNNSISQETFDKRMADIKAGMPSGKAEKQQSDAKSNELDEATGKEPGKPKAKPKQKTDAEIDAEVQEAMKALEAMKQNNLDLFNDLEDSLDNC